MDRHLRIKKFVQQVLGCTCPDKVFEQIEEGKISFLSGKSIKSITIGGKLLIYILHVQDDSKDLHKKLYMLLQAGRKEREEKGLNRFRAVLACTDPQAVEIPAQLCFSQFEDKDERMHIHVVPEDVFINLYYPI